MLERELTANASPLLVAAAFGADPGTTNLPPAASPVDSWLRGVALGGQGHYARARAELARVGSAPGPLAALATCTTASFVRQMGNHAQAAVLDGSALVRAGAGREPLAVAARCDALTGLAADSLGSARLRLAARLLERAQVELGDADLWRQRLRLSWVSTELALAAGDDVSALAHARRSDGLAAACPSIRHQVKTRLLRAVAEGVSGQLAESLQLAREVAAQCDSHGLLPLRWAVAMLCAGIEPAAGHQRDVGVTAALLARRGGSFATV